jgi:hypothetical protein
MHDSNCWNNDSGAKLPNVFCASATLFASLEVVPLADALLLAVDSTVEVSVPDTLDPPESLREDCPPHAANTTTLADKTAPSTRCREEKREDNTLRASRNV